MNCMETVRTFVVENCLFGEGDRLQEHTSFIQEGIIDSTGILELVFFLEETFHISIEDDELIPENMDSLHNIAAYVQQKLSNTAFV